MLDRAWGGAIRRSGQNHPRETRKSARGCRRLHIEPLEGRTLLAASLAPIAPVTVQAGQGYQVPLNGSGSATPQTFTVTSSNPDIKATVAQGQFLTLNVLHTASPSNPGDVSFSGPITFQLFNDLTPLTASKIESFVQNGDYNAGQFFRIANGFPGPSDYIIQGGTSADATQGNSNLPGTPFPDEFKPQLVFNGQGQLAMANAGPNTNGSQFFITTGSPQFLNFRHTIFGQLVSDPLNIVPRMTQVARQANPKTGESNTLPVSPIQITSASLSNANPNGVIHVDATQAHSGETSTITAVATDPSTNTTATQTFQVNTIAFGDTGAVRVIGRVLVVTPVPRAGRHTNTITVSQMTSPTGTANDTLQVNVNGTIDTIQPLVSAIDRIVVFGSKASDKITIDPSVDPAIAVTLDGGHGGLHNRLQAGDNSTREHGWFGFNTLVGGSGPNQLVGRAGHVKFVPTPTTTEIFAGNPEPGGSFFHPHPPGGTFFKFVKGRLVPIPTPTQPHRARTNTGGSTTTGTT